MPDLFAGRPRPLVHVGYPKALSSWLQKFLFQPAHGYAKVMNPLEAKLDIISAPPYGYDAAAAAAGIAQRLHEDTSLVPVVTSEALIGNPAIGGADGELNARRLADLAPDATILLVVREQRAIIRSLYKTMVGFLGFPHSIERLLAPRDAYATPQFSLDFLRYDQAVAMYQNLFGADNVVVVPFELFGADPAAFLGRISAATGAPSDTSPPTGSIENAGSRLVDIQRERMRNVLFEGGPFNYLGLREPSTERTQARLRRINQTRDDSAANRRLERRFAQQVAEATRGQFNQGNAALAALTGIDLGTLGYEV